MPTQTNQNQTIELDIAQSDQNENTTNLEITNINHCYNKQDDNSNNPPTASENSLETSARPIRQKHDMSYFYNYVCNSSSNHSKSSTSRILYPIAYFHYLIICLVQKGFFHVC